MGQLLGQQTGLHSEIMWVPQKGQPWVPLLALRLVIVSELRMVQLLGPQWVTLLGLRWVLRWDQQLDFPLG